MFAALRIHPSDSPDTIFGYPDLLPSKRFPEMPDYGNGIGKRLNESGAGPTATR